MNHFPRIALPLIVSLAFTAGCEDKAAKDAAAAVENDKAARAASATELVEPIATISAYLPELHPVDKNDKYAPERHLDLDKTAEHAADEIRHAANFTKQKLQRNETEGVKVLIDALREVASACADAKEPAHFAKCEASVKALDAAIEKSQTANEAVGVTGKLPRVGPDAITDRAKKAIAPLLNARGPGPAEKAFIAKRSDKAASASDVLSACQAALSESEMTAGQYERREDALRVVSATHKMSLDSQCNKLTAADTRQKEINECRKNIKTPECKIACAKTKTVIDDGVPAAAFASLEKDYGEICKEDE